MPPTLADRLVHILEAINTVQESLAHKTLESFANDLLLRLAIERSLEIISEASRRIPPEVKAQRNEINWQGIADLGNLLRHAYHRVDAKTLWDIASRDLPSLKTFVEGVIQEAGES
jgi:uncharacterized protein with HEPN domain